MFEQNFNIDREQLDLSCERGNEDRIVADPLQVVSGKMVIKEENLILPTACKASPEDGFFQNEPPPRKEIFISYSQEDVKWLKILKTHLTPLERYMNICFWSDNQIMPGSLWRKEIRQALARAKMAILLVSPHFLASDFITKEELPPLLSAAEREGLTILWIAVSPSLYELTPIAAYTPLNDSTRPLDWRRDRVNHELVSICKRIRDIMGVKASHFI